MCSYTLNGSKVTLPCKILISDTHCGIDNGEKSWFSEPHHEYKHVSSDGLVKNYVGTYRSPRCLKAGYGTTISLNGMCDLCHKIPHLKSLRERLIRRSNANAEEGERDLSGIRNVYLNETEKVAKLRAQQEKLDSHESQIFLLTRENLRMKLRARTLRQKLAEYAKQGSVKSICAQLDKAAQLGLLEDEIVLKELLQSTAANFHKKANGKRYKASVQEFYEVIMCWGGPRLASFIAINLFGPEIHSLYRWRKKKKIELELGLQEKNFAVLASVYSEAMKKIAASEVPVECSEDETAIIQEVTYHQENDILLGFCGTNGDNHVCSDRFCVEVGEGEPGYERVINAFNENKIGNYARAILINPIHSCLPKLPVLLMPTCNCFDSKFVSDQWETVSDYYDRYLQPVL